MPDGHEDRLRQHEELLQGLARMFQAQHEMNQRVEGFIQEQREFNAQQVEINTRLEITQAHIETLLARMLPTGENGREA
jgi:hypothetical protein